LLLDIAQKEKDYTAVKILSCKIIKKHFIEKYYNIYKELFNPEEWKKEREQLFTHYCNKKYFDNSAADLLKAENDKEFLMKKVNILLSPDRIEKYFYSNTPDYKLKIREMFIKIINFYVENFTGKHFYEHILLLLKRLSCYKDGRKTALN